jgi:hypothetical protein
MRKLIRPAGVSWQLLSGLALSLLWQPSQAEEWRLDRSAWLRTEYADNLRLLPGVKDDTFGFTGGFDVQAAKASEIRKIELRALASGTLYDNNDIPDDWLALLGVGYSRQISERSLLGIDGSYVNDSTLDNVADQTFDPGDIDPGVTSVRVRRSKLDLTPSWTYDLTERSGVQLAYDLTAVEYGSGKEEAGLDNYVYQNASGKLFYRLTESTTVNATVQPFYYSSSDADADYNGGTLVAGVEHRFSRSLLGSLNAGAYTAHFDVDGESERDNGGVFNASLVSRGERSRLRALIGRDLLPSGSGQMREADQILLSATRSVGPRLDLGIRSRFLKTTNVGVGDSTERRYVLVEPTVAWRLTERLDLLASYRYRSKDDGSDDKAYGNRVSLSLTYNWPSGPELR